MENIKHRSLQIENMGCPGCPKTITDGLLELDGVQNVKADYASGNVDVVYDLMKITLEQIEEALGKMGYVIHESVIGNLKKGMIHFTEGNEKSNIEAVPRPCCSAYNDRDRDGLINVPPFGT